MPELPDLEYIREFLSSRVIGVAIAELRVLGPIVVRSSDPGRFSNIMRGKRFKEVRAARKIPYFLL